MNAERQETSPSAKDQGVLDDQFHADSLVIGDGIPGSNLRKTLTEDSLKGLGKAQIDLIPGLNARKKARRAFQQGGNPSEAAAKYLKRTELKHKGRR